jgi:hypothetical protein
MKKRDQIGLVSSRQMQRLLRQGLRRQLTIQNRRGRRRVRRDEKLAALVLFASISKCSSSAVPVASAPAAARVTRRINEERSGTTQWVAVPELNVLETRHEIATVVSRFGARAIPRTKCRFAVFIAARDAYNFQTFPAVSIDIH